MFGREWRSRELLIGGDFAHNGTRARAGIPSRRRFTSDVREDAWTLQGGCPTESDERSGLAPVIAAVLSAYQVGCFFHVCSSSWPPRRLCDYGSAARNVSRKSRCATSISACGRSTSLSTARSTAPYSVTTYCM